VLATDASRAQLDAAMPHPRVDYRQELAGETGLRSGSVDLTTAAQAAHWFELDGYYSEVRRVAAPGAVVALLSYGLPSLDGSPDDVLRRFHIDVLAPHWPPQRRFVEEGYRTLPFPFAELRPPAFRMEVSWPVEAFLGYVETWSAVRKMEAAEGRGRIEDFRGELTHAWGTRARRIEWPLSLRVGRIG